MQRKTVRPAVRGLSATFTADGDGDGDGVEGGVGTTWLEPVTDEVHAAADRAAS